MYKITYIKNTISQSPITSPGRTKPGKELAALVLSVIAYLFLVATASQVWADTSQFRGMNWARIGDNFTTGRLVLDGLDINDSYDTVYNKATAVYDDMQNLMGINTVRLPINTNTVADAWWDQYRAAIDAATDRGFKVILAYWEDGAASGGQITNIAAWNTMWSKVTYTFGSNSLVYFEPMNEPHGYSSGNWRDVAAAWLDYHYSAPANRVLIDGVGYAQDVRDLCSDSRFSGTLLALHYYTFFSGATRDYWGWRNEFETLQSNCYDRVVVTEFGAEMHTGIDYMTSSYSGNWPAYLRGITGSMHDRSIGSVYWPALGGKITSGYDFDGYSVLTRQGSATNITGVGVRNISGARRVMFGWGDDDPQIDTGNEHITNVYSGKVLDIKGASTANSAPVIQYDWNGNDWQRWSIEDVGSGFVRIVSVYSGKCLDVSGTDNGSTIQQYDCWGGTNQQFTLRDAGSGSIEIVDRRSGKCLDVPGFSTANGTTIAIWDCNGGNNQHWIRAND